MKHTKEPWEMTAVTGHSGVVIIKCPDDFDWVASLQISNVPEWKYNGERIVACVNALAGIKNPSAVAKMIEAARIIIADIDGDADGCYDVGHLKNLRDKVAALAAKTEVKP